MLSPFRLGTVDLRNRMAGAYMTRVSATADSLAIGRMADYSRAFAEGGFGLVITEGIYTGKAFAQGYLHQPGLTNDAKAAAWRRVTGQVHAAGSKIVAQLMRAGALSRGNPHRTGTVGASAVHPMGAQIAGFRGPGPYRLPTKMGLRGIAQALEGFAAATIKAQATGSDGVEVHGANAYLLDQFLTERVSRRVDAYGGPTLARARLMAEALAAVQAAVGPGFLVGVRVSQTKVNDQVHSCAGREDDARVIFSTLGASGADYVHTTEHEAWRQAFVGDGRSLAALAKARAGLPVIANGALHDPTQATAMLRSGQADLIALACGALTNTDWPERVRDGRAILEFDRESLLPLADLASSDACTHARRAAEAAAERIAAARAQEVA